jgi:hypothetical protein
MTWLAADDETIFRCVNILTGEIMSLEEVNSEYKPPADGIRSTLPRGQAEEPVRLRPSAKSD